MKHDNLVTCPNCKHEFDIETALTADLEKEIDAKLRKEFNEKYVIEKRKAEDALKQKEEAIAAERSQWIEQHLNTGTRRQ